MTLGVERLAVFGAPPAFAEPLHVGRPLLGERDRLLKRLNDVFDRGWLSNDGPAVRELEERIAELIGVEHCVATANGTLALQLLLRACDVSGRVILPSFTFVATAHAVHWEGLEVVFCDIDPATHHLDPLHAGALVDGGTSAIVAVHLWGRPAPITQLQAVADRHGVPLVFDAAHAFGSAYEGVPVGQFGVAEVFSFHATKLLHTFEGGAVATNDGDVARKVRLMRNFGFEDYDHVVSLGINAKMTEVAAAMGLSLLESFDEIAAGRRRTYDRYEGGLAGIAGVRLISDLPYASPNFQHVVVEVDEGEAGLARDDLHRTLWAENVLARRYFYPGCHRMEPYRSLNPKLDERLPNTNFVASRVLSLPTGGGVGDLEVDRVCELIAVAVENGAAVRARLERRETNAP